MILVTRRSEATVSLGPHNIMIKLTVSPVTVLACASTAPGQPAAYQNVRALK